MKPLLYNAIGAQQVATHSVAVMKLEVTLNASATAGLFLQLFDTAAAAVNGDVPVKTWPASECGYKEFKNGELSLAKGLYVALSTTAATLTLAEGLNDLMDILLVELTIAEAPSGTTVAGSLTGPAVADLQVWAEAAGPKRLMRIEADNTLGDDRYLMLFAKDAPTDGDAPIMQWALDAGAVRTVANGNACVFGINGLDVYSQDLSGTRRVGCTLKLSSTTQTLTEIVSADTKLKAEYR